MKCELCKRYKARGIAPTRGEFPEPVSVCNKCAEHLPNVDKDGFPLYHFKSENGFWYFVFIHSNYLYPYFYPSFRPDFRHIDKDKVARLMKMRAQDKKLCKRILPYSYSSEAEKEDILYFAYGSDMNMNILKKLKVKFKVLEKARFFGGNLKFVKDEKTGKGKANISVAPDEDYVEGILYILEEEKELDKMDRYTGRDKDYCLLRKILVHLESGQPALALTYISKLGEIEAKPDKRYINHMIKGARKHNLSEKWIKNIEEKANKKNTRNIAGKSFRLQLSRPEA